MVPNTGKAVSSHMRFERKFFVTAIDRNSIKNIIAVHPALFSEIYHPRTVNNIYLDSHGLKGYFDNIEGVSKRKKYRIRWYGSMLGLIEKATLEVKEKEGMVGIKSSFPLKPFTVDSSLTRTRLIQVLEDSEIPQELLINLKTLDPVLLNRYRRGYFLSADSNFRVTVDWEMEFFRLNNYLNNLMEKYTDREHVIVELKYNTQNDDLAPLVTRYFPLRVTKSSKYIRGLQFLGL